jgi:hypothetical protein
MTIKRRDAFILLAGVALAPVMCGRTDARAGSSSGGPDGDDDDTLAAVFAEMARTGRAFLPGGTYRVSRPILIPPGVLEGGDVILDFRGANPADFHSGVCVAVNGAPRMELPNLLRDLAIGDRTLRFADPHGLLVGDAFQLAGTVDFAGNGYRYYYRKGEMFRVAEIIDATNLIVDNACRDSYPAGGIEVWKRAGDRFSQKCASLTILGHDGIKYAAAFEGIDDSTVSNIRCEGGRQAALSITDCYHMVGENISAHQTIAGTYPYGCVVANSQDVHLQGECYGYFNGFTVGGGRTDGGKVGMNRDIHFEGKAGSHPTAGLSGGNLHGNCEYCSLRGTFANGVSLGGNKNEAHGEFTKSGHPPIEFSGMHGHDFRITGTLRTTGDVDLSTKVGALHQSGYGAHARYGGVTEISLQIYAPTAPGILCWRPSDLSRSDIELRLSLDIMKAHPKKRMIGLKKNGNGEALPLVTLDRLDLIDNSIPILWSVDHLTRFQGAGVRAMTGHG